MDKAVQVGKALYTFFSYQMPKAIHLQDNAAYKLNSIPFKQILFDILLSKIALND